MLKIADEKISEILKGLEAAPFAEFTGEKYKVLDPGKLKRNYRNVLVIDRIKEELEKNEVYTAKRADGELMVFNGAYWQPTFKEDFRSFLSEALIALGYGYEEAKYYGTKDDLYKQFGDTCQALRSPETDQIIINVRNGTLVIEDDQVTLKPFDLTDGLTYQLPFEYDPAAECTEFQKFLDDVLPEKESQMILSEFLGSIFLDNKKVKHEKALLLYGTGSNGKSVVHEIVQNLLGDQNCSNFSLESITDSSGYTRAKLDGKLLNYASEISGDVNSGKFKQLVSGEPIEVRLPYKEPFTLRAIPKLMFNINSFPKNSEKTPAFYRRLMVLPFSKTIEPAKQDKSLAYRISNKELPGILNWVLVGMKRLNEQGTFTESPAARDLLNDFRIENDSVASFLEREQLMPSEKKDKEHTVSMNGVYKHYEKYCKDNGLMKVSIQSFGRRLDNLGYARKKTKTGVIFYAQIQQEGDEGDDE